MIVCLLNRLSHRYRWQVKIFWQVYLFIYSVILHNQPTIALYINCLQSLKWVYVICIHTFSKNQTERRKYSTYNYYKSAADFSMLRRTSFFLFALTSGQTKKSRQTWSKSYTNKMHTDHQRWALHPQHDLMGRPVRFKSVVSFFFKI